MSARLATVLIFLFCGTMTVLLVRSVLYPEESRLAEVAPLVPFELFVRRAEGSHLDIWDGRRIIGKCDVVPENSNSGPKVRTEKIKVRLDIRLQLPQPILDSSIIDVAGTAVVHAAKNLTEPDFRIELDNSAPLIRLSIKQAPDQQGPAFKLTRGETVVFDIPSGKMLEGTDGLLAAGMLQALGMPPDALAGNQTANEVPSTVRTGIIKAGGQSFDGYLFTSGADEETKFRLYMSNTGEILRVKTPLGLEMLAESLRPAGAVAPKLERYQLPGRKS